MIWVFVHMILGMILALLVLLLVLLILLLAGPFAYEIEGGGTSADPSCARARFRLSWVLFLARFELRYDEGHIRAALRLAGIPLDRLLPEAFRSGNAASQGSPSDLPQDGRKDRKKDAQKETRKNARKKTRKDAQKNRRTDAQKERRTDAQKYARKDARKDAHISPAKEASRQDRHRSARKTTDTVEADGEKRTAAPRDSVRNRREPRSRMKRISAALGRREVKEAAALIWHRLKRLIRHISPRDAQGYAEYGFEDPSVTGMITALLAATMPLHKNRLSLSPDFSCETRASGQIRLRGRFFLAVILFHIVCILADKNVRNVYRQLQQGRAGHL